MRSFPIHFHTKISTNLRYWMQWALLAGGVMLALHCYLDYRNGELDKRIEQLNR